METRNNEEGETLRFPCDNAQFLFTSQMKPYFPHTNTTVSHMIIVIRRRPSPHNIKNAFNFLEVNKCLKKRHLVSDQTWNKQSSAGGFIGNCSNPDNCRRLFSYAGREKVQAPCLITLENALELRTSRSPEPEI